MTRTHRLLLTALLLTAALAGCGGDPDTAAAPSATPATTSASPSLSPSPSPPPSPSVSASPSYKPKLATVMSDAGGSCVSKGRCGYYVAGSTCKNVEWCKKAHLVEPGTWATDGGSGPTDCMWGLSKAPEYGVDDGGYASSYTEVVVPKGAIFDTHNCVNDWEWLHP
ncbi:hypothetical protein [Micromonospora tarensis]|uniref:Uncharacterized protein n=1 Tax=Micromonospora tarensis TaxID=2806100 RepID=A0ABS1YCK5_9ACTN|nr:hypothetical protein [Micromonospora tarensis]MBM0275082.1 hypothetical protein [Micromonospora tarensis]